MNMKVTRERLIEIIKEEISLLEAESPTEFKVSDFQKTLSGGAAKKSFKDTATRMASDSETTGKERQIIDRMKNLLETAASELDITTGDPYKILARVYKMLGEIINKQEQPNE